MKLNKQQKTTLNFAIKKYLKTNLEEFEIADEKINKFLNKDFTGLEFIIIMKIFRKYIYH